MFLTKLALKAAARPPKLEKFERFLFVGPHPDDIEIGAGATAAKLAAQGKSICFLICTDGRHGDGYTDLRGDALIERRRQESISAAAKLGVTDVRFLNLGDGEMYTADELRQGIAQVLGDFRPEVVFAPEPCVHSECHADHLNVGETVRRLVFFAPIENIMAQMNAKRAPVRALAYYMTARPNQFIGTRGFMPRQLDAIFGCHLSQFPADDMDTKFIRLYLHLRSIDFGMRSLKGRAEGFRVLGRTHMHCLPEA